VQNDLDTKFELLRMNAEHFAYDLGKSVIIKPKASIWIIFMPIFFVFYAQKLQKYKKDIQDFARGYQFTKTLALGAAREEKITGEPAEIFFADPPKEVGTPEIWEVVRAVQREEVDILRRHYLKLMDKDGETHADLVRAAYTTAGAYRSFLNRLHKAEEAVNEAVLTHLQTTPEARATTKAIEKRAEEMRLQEMDTIFS